MQTPAAIETLKKSYIGRHWRGDLSLPVSYFVNGVIGGAVALIIVTIASELLFAETGPWSLFIGLATIWASVIIISVWQMVGIWRSSDRHPSRGGSVFWATVAKVMVVIGIFQTGVVIVQNCIPQLQESWNILTGDKGVGSYQMRIINAGTEVEYIGGIPFGASEKLQALLDAAPMVQTIHLDSHGGRISEAEKVREIISSHGLNTYISHECLSACTVAYLGGHERYLNTRASVGFHASSFPGIDDADMHAENLRIVAEAERRGTSRDFAKRAYLTPATDMWYPSIDEMISARFATEVASGQFALSGFGYDPTKEDISKSLLRVPLYSAINSRDPEIYSLIADRIFEGWRKGEPEGYVFTSTRTAIGSLVEKYLPTASDEALLSFGNILLEELDAIGSQSALACHSFLFPEAGTEIDFSRYLSPELQRRELDVMELVITTGSQGHRVTAPANQIERLYENLISTIIENYDFEIAQVLMQMAENDPSLDREGVCLSTYVLYSEVMKMPRQNALALLRDMFGQ